MLMAMVLCLLGAEKDFKEAYKELSAKRTSVTFSSYSAGRNGHRANAHLFIGFEESLLVDTGGSVTDTKKIIEMTKSAGKKLRSVFLTSAHADQTSGIDLVHEAFPDARFYSSKDVALAIGKRGVSIEATKDVMFGGEVISVLSLATSCAALHMSALSVLAGGCTWNGDFSFEGAGVTKTVSAIEAMQRLRAGKLLPNYGDGGDSSTILASMREKLQPK